MFSGCSSVCVCVHTYVHASVPGPAGIPVLNVKNSPMRLALKFTKIPVIKVASTDSNIWVIFTCWPIRMIGLRYNINTQARGHPRKPGSQSLGRKRTTFAVMLQPEVETSKNSRKFSPGILGWVDSREFPIGGHGPCPDGSIFRPVRRRWVWVTVTVTVNNFSRLVYLSRCRNA